MRDGVILRTDHYAPAVDSAPTVLVRTPYGRTGLHGLAARIVSECGFHVVMSSCRGTSDSGGVFDPLRHERDDGLDTMDWLRQQPWFTGRLGTFGVSYVGYTQWAIADVPEIEAMATVVTASQFRDPTYAGESFSLYTTLAWVSLLSSQGNTWLANTVELLRGQPRLREAFAHLPLNEADRLATGEEVAFFRRWLSLAGRATDEVDDYWRDLDHQHRLSGTTARVLMIGGWHDILLPWQLRDYAALRAAGAQPHLTIGPWTHGSGGLFTGALRESIAWLRAHLYGEKHYLRQHPVRVNVVGGGGWREYDDWPPPGISTVRPWYLHAGGRLSQHEPLPSTPDRFLYDPKDPTPSVGGPLLLTNVAGPRDNREIEARPDVLVYTTGILDTDVEIIGPVSATVWVRASRPYFDIFVRLCDVQGSGRSLNVCDGLVRVAPGRYPTGADGTSAVAVELWPTAHRFRAGHRIRLQVSGGAHPRYARHTGTDDPLATAINLWPVRVEVFHDPDRPSAVHLPVAACRSRPAYR
jgi:putative CocE/NonD family hydrolase